MSEWFTLAISVTAVGLLWHIARKLDGIYDILDRQFPESEDDLDD